MSASFSGALSGFSGVGGCDSPVAALAKQHFFAIGREPKAAHILHQLFSLAFLQIELLNGRRFVAERRGFQYHHLAGLAGRESDVIAVGHRKGQNALADAVEVNFYDGRFLRLVLLLFGRLIVCGGRGFFRSVSLGGIRGLLFVAFRRQRRRVVLRKHNQVDVPRNRPVNAGHVQPTRREPHVGAGRQVEILSAFVPVGKAGVAQTVGDLRGPGCRQLIEI